MPACIRNRKWGFWQDEMLLIELIRSIDAMATLVQMASEEKHVLRQLLHTTFFIEFFYCNTFAQSSGSNFLFHPNPGLPFFLRLSRAA